MYPLLIITLIIVGGDELTKKYLLNIEVLKKGVLSVNELMTKDDEGDLL